jgi:hypothetical protein
MAKGASRGDNPGGLERLARVVHIGNHSVRVAAPIDIVEGYVATRHAVRLQTIWAARLQSPPRHNP